MSFSLPQNSSFLVVLRLTVNPLKPFKRVTGRVTCKMLGMGGRKRNGVYYCITGEGGFVQPSIQLWLLVTDRILAWIF